MNSIKIDFYHAPDLEVILDRDEKILWTGAPSYGKGFFEPTWHEKFILISYCVGVIILLLSTPFLVQASDSPLWAILGTFGLVAFVFAGISVWTANARQFVLSSFAYFVTDKRALVCRYGRNWKLNGGLYVVSCPHSDTYPYTIVSTRPYPSLRIGSLLDENELQPFGFGLSHPGQPYLMGRTMAPVLFEQVPDAKEILAIIQKNCG